MIRLLNPFLAAAALFAMLHWAARWRGWARLGAATKPPVMVALIFWSLSLSAWQDGMLWFGAGLVFSLAGDVALQLPRRFFPVGLLSFLLAHLCYTAGFCLPAPALHPILIPLVALLALASFFFFRKLVIVLRSKAYRKRFIAPVLLYGLVLDVMVLSACQSLLRPDWPFQAAVMASLGGLLFLLSDSLLAYNRFIEPLPGGRTFEMMTYHMAQAAIIGGAILYR